MNKEFKITGLGNFNIEKNTNPENEIVVTTIEEVKVFTQNYKNELKKSTEVHQIATTLDISNMKSILSYGEKTAEDISKVSDSLLKNVRTIDKGEAGSTLVHLTKILKRFDIADFKLPETDEKQTLISKFLDKFKIKVEDMLTKYDSMGAEVDKIYIILKKYEQDILSETKDLELLYKTNLNYYQELEKYIVAGEMVLEQLDTQYIPQIQEQLNNNFNAALQQDLVKLQNCRNMIEQRLLDLRVSETVAMQSLPIIEQMALGNFDLIRTIKTSFIITLPMFKQSLVNCVMLKRQEMMKENIKHVRDVNNMLIVRNADQTMKQVVELAKFSGETAIDIDSLQQAHEIITKGMIETQKILNELKESRKHDTQKLEQIKYQNMQLITKKDLN